MAEFTGERVVPGQVEPDLWNEHLARYAFAQRLAANKRVLDIGCGAGYGSAELAHIARLVIGVDASPEAIAEARRRYGNAPVSYLTARGEALPFASASFDLILAFEVIEHLDDWPRLLEEASRLLASGGQFIVSTPNRLYYAEARKLTGPNPYHTHEFVFEEFCSALKKHFRSVSLYLQNHVQGIAFQPATGATASAQIAVQRADLMPEESHFFVAVCAASSQTGAPTWVYLPSTANLLRERERHIELLEGELKQKDAWLEKTKAEHAALVELHAAQAAELIQRAEWTEGIQQELKGTQARVVELQEELDTLKHATQVRVEDLEAELEKLRSAAQAAVEGYDSKIAALEVDIAERTAVFQENEKRIEAELGQRTRFYQEREISIQAELDERTRVFQENEKRLEAEMVEHSRFYQESEKRLETELTERTSFYQESEKRLGAELAERTLWAQDIDRKLSAKVDELQRCVEQLHHTESILEERTHWAQDLDERLTQALALLKTAQESRWLQLGKRLGVGPKIGGN